MGFSIKGVGIFRRVKRSVDIKSRIHCFAQETGSTRQNTLERGYLKKVVDKVIIYSGCLRKS